MKLDLGCSFIGDYIRNWRVTNGRWDWREYQLRKVSILADNTNVSFIQEDNRVILQGLSQENPDPTDVSITVFKMEFDEVPIISHLDILGVTLK